MIKFNIGQTYSTRSICDYDMIESFTIVARTPKTVTVKICGETVRRGVYLWNDIEHFKPHGSYSMCSIVGADDRDLSKPQ